MLKQVSLCFVNTSLLLKHCDKQNKYLSYNPQHSFAVDYNLEIPTILMNYHLVLYASDGMISKKDLKSLKLLIHKMMKMKS